MSASLARLRSKPGTPLTMASATTTSAKVPTMQFRYPGLAQEGSQPPSLYAFNQPVWHILHQKIVRVRFSYTSELAHHHKNTNKQPRYTTGTVKRRRYRSWARTTQTRQIHIPHTTRRLRQRRANKFTAGQPVICSHTVQQQTANETQPVFSGSGCVY
jgi:hypothetical protein